MRLLNASATENVVLALPGHRFTIIAMDGNPVPNPRSVEVLSLAVAERVDAVVEMNSPGVWILGSTLEKARSMGLGTVVEYAGRTGAPAWKDPAPAEWDYTQFANAAAAPAPDETFVLTFRDIGPKPGSNFDIWTINNKSWPDVDPIRVQAGKRYRLLLRNGSGDQHPIHLHRHTFEVAQIGHAQLSGLRKDVINVMPLETVGVDFVADNPGPTLFHCHQQLERETDLNTLKQKLLLGTLAGCLLPAPCLAQDSAVWSAYGPDGDHYSTLKQIDRGNVHSLKTAWSFDTGEKGNIETNPLIVGGTLYAYTPSQKVIALDAASGVEMEV